jgi:hypothetical protein
VGVPLGTGPGHAISPPCGAPGVLEPGIDGGGEGEDEEQAAIAPNVTDTSHTRPSTTRGCHNRPIVAA